MALQRQTLSIPIAQGLDTKTDEKQVPIGKALSLENVRFQKTGKLSKRFGLLPLSNASSSGLLSDSTVYCVASDNRAMNAITSLGVYNFSESYDEWKKVSDLKDYIKIKSEFLTKTTLNQFNPEMDFSEKFNILATTYREREEQDSLKSNSTEAVTVCLEDISTGLKVLNSFGLTTGRYKTLLQKVVIADDLSEPKIFVFVQVSNGVLLLTYNKYLELQFVDGSPFVFIAPSGYNQFYSRIDVVKDGTNIFLTVITGTTINLYKFDYSGNTVGTRNLTVTNRHGRTTTESPLGFSTIVDSAYLHVTYLSNTSGEVSQYVVGIGFNKSLATAIPETRIARSNLINLSICKNSNEIVLALQEYSRSSVGSYVYYNNRVFKYFATYSGSGYVFDFDSIDDSTLVGNRLELLSRPFIANGSIGVVCKCPELTQKTGIIYNLSERKSISSFSPYGLSDSRVIVDSTIRPGTGFCNAISISNKVYSYFEKIYGTDTDNPAAYDFIANVAISKLSLDFNTDYTSATKAKVGETIYYTNGRVSAMDSRGCYESGFELRPTINYASIVTGVANPNVASKTFSYKAIYTFYNGKGEIERSIPSDIVTLTTPANASYLTLIFKSLGISYKSNVDIILYRTENNGSVFYRCSNATNLPLNNDVTLYDAISDAELRNNERLYTTGGVLESDVTPNAKFSTSGGNRLFLGGLEDQDEIACSNKQIYAEAVSFNGFNRIRVSSGASADKTPISALGYMDGKLIIFRQQSIYFVQGDGPNELGVGSFTEPEIVSSDVGCTEPRSVINTPMGLMFKSRKGIYLLSRNLSVEYIGAAVEDFNSYNVVSSVLSDKYNEARFYVSNGDCLVYNFLFQTWSTFKNQTTVEADLWKGFPVLIKSNKIFKETENTYLDNSSYYSMKFASPWLKLDLVQGYARAYQLWIIGSYKSAHTLKCRVYVDYDSSTYEDYSLVYDNSSSPQYQFQISLPNQKVESIKFEIYDESQSGNGESYDLSNIQIEVGMKAGGYKLAANKSY